MDRQREGYSIRLSNTAIHNDLSLFVVFLRTRRHETSQYVHIDLPHLFVFIRSFRRQTSIEAVIFVVLHEQRDTDGWMDGWVEE